MEHTIAVAVSGGVDSFVSAYLVKQKYTNLFGIHFITGFEKDPPDFSSMEAQLGIKIHCIDFSQIFKHEVMDYFTSTYLSGKTPNPCLVCNQKIKFKELLKAAQALGADRLATGHYARIIRDLSGRPGLFKGEDSLKEQSYFLSMLTVEQLEKAIFPLGELKKQDVIRLAADKGFDIPVKSESQDVCFIHDKTLAEFFIRQGVFKFEPGDIVNAHGKRIGTHQGLHTYTIGQRRKINCPGPRPYYVIQIDIKNNQLVVGFEEDLFEHSVHLKNVNMIVPLDDTQVRVMAKIRYSHQGASAFLTVSGTEARLEFETPQRAVTPGQGAVFYQDQRVLGAGFIE